MNKSLLTPSDTYTHSVSPATPTKEASNLRRRALVPFRMITRSNKRRRSASDTDGFDGFNGFRPEEVPKPPAHLADSLSTSPKGKKKKQKKGSGKKSANPKKLSNTAPGPAPQPAICNVTEPPTKKRKMTEQEQIAELKKQLQASKDQLQASKDREKELEEKEAANQATFEKFVDEAVKDETSCAGRYLVTTITHKWDECSKGITECSKGITECKTGLSETNARLDSTIEKFSTDISYLRSQVDRLKSGNGYNPRGRGRGSSRGQRGGLRRGLGSRSSTSPSDPPGPQVHISAANNRVVVLPQIILPEGIWSNNSSLYRSKQHQIAYDRFMAADPSFNYGAIKFWKDVKGIIGREYDLMVGFYSKVDCERIVRAAAKKGMAIMHEESYSRWINGGMKGKFDYLIDEAPTQAEGGTPTDTPVSTPNELNASLVDEEMAEPKNTQTGNSQSGPNAAVLAPDTTNPPTSTKTTPSEKPATLPKKTVYTLPTHPVLLLSTWLNSTEEVLQTQRALEHGTP